MADQKAKESTDNNNTNMLSLTIIFVLLAFSLAGSYYYFAADVTISDTVTDNMLEENRQMVMHINPELHYFDMPKPFIVNFPKKTGINLFQLSIAFLTEGAGTVEILRKHEPMIRNNILMLISGQVPKELKTKAGKEKLQQLILEEVGQALQNVNAKNKVQNVFFTSFVMQ